MSAFTKRIFLFVFFPLLVMLGINHLTQNNLPLLRYFLAASPILVVLIIMIIFRVPGQIAGPLGLLTGLVVAVQAFGLTWDVLWVSQTKGLLLTLFVLAVFWPALFLYNIVNQAGGIQSIALTLEKLITDRGILLIIIAWAFSSMLEGLAGFGLPIAIVSPMLVGLGVPPILAVASVAIGHAWSVTFGDMGVIFQTLIAVVKTNPVELAYTAAILEGIACLACGIAVAHLFKRLDRWPLVIVLAGLMGMVQFIFAVNGLPALAGFFAGLFGVIGGILINYWFARPKNRLVKPKFTGALLSAMLSYGSLALLMAIITVVQPINAELKKIVWSVALPAVQTISGFATGAVTQTYRPLLHPGTSIIIIAIFSYIYNRRQKLYPSPLLKKIAVLTSKASLTAIIGIATMVGLSALMDHTGMNYALAEALSSLFRSAFPLVSPLIGMIGAFATGSNNNSNVLFASLQEGIALLLKFSPAIIIGAQTTGGSLGSMIAPAKIFVGCSTVGLQGRDGEVLRITLPYGITIGLVMGVITMLAILFF